jgi:hypothetical protein
MSIGKKVITALVATAMLALAADVPATPKPSDSDKLKIRDLQLPRLQTAGQMASLEAQWKDLATTFQKYKAAEDEAVAELGKRLGCDIDAQSLECKPKAAAKAEPGKKR